MLWYQVLCNSIIITNIPLFISIDSVSAIDPFHFYATTNSILFPEPNRLRIRRTTGTRVYYIKVNSTNVHRIVSNTNVYHKAIILIICFAALCQSLLLGTKPNLAKQQL